MGLMNWLNEPSIWQAENSGLRVVTGLRTDFWRVTHYGFIRDNGHFYYQEWAGDFTAQVKVEGKYEALYDQAGMMVRLDAANWIKAGVEYTDGLPHFSAVVTREFSDWSVLPANSAGRVWLRLTKLGSAVKIQYSVDGLSYPMLRLAYFPDSRPIQVGLMCCSPEREGFEVEFSDFRISEPISTGLHE
jgi:regulation of enolase protein 1 (concanavalin A-like superfamily)